MWYPSLPKSPSHTLWGSVWKDPLKAFHLRRCENGFKHRSSQGIWTRDSVAARTRTWWISTGIWSSNGCVWSILSQYSFCFCVEAPVGVAWMFHFETPVHNFICFQDTLVLTAPRKQRLSQSSRHGPPWRRKLQMPPPPSGERTWCNRATPDAVEWVTDRPEFLIQLQFSEFLVFQRFDAAGCFAALGTFCNVVLEWVKRVVLTTF